MKNLAIALAFGCTMAGFTACTGSDEEETTREENREMIREGIQREMDATKDSIREDMENAKESMKEGFEKAKEETKESAEETKRKMKETKEVWSEDEK